MAISSTVRSGLARSWRSEIGIVWSPASGGIGVVVGARKWVMLGAMGGRFGWWAAWGEASFGFLDFLGMRRMWGIELCARRFEELKATALESGATLKSRPRPHTECGGTQGDPAAERRSTQDKKTESCSESRRIQDPTRSVGVPRSEPIHSTGLS
jgi:hypothetical protein